MHYDSFEDHLIAQGCSGVINTHSGVVYQNKHNLKGSYVKRENWLPVNYVKSICAELDIEVPADVDDNNFNAYQFIR